MAELDQNEKELFSLEGLLKNQAQDWRYEYIKLYAEMKRRMTRLQALYTYYKDRVEFLEKEQCSSP